MHFDLGSAIRRSPSLRPVLQSILPPVLWLVSEETAVLPGVFSIFTLHIDSKLARPWLMVSPWIPEYVTASCRIRFGLRPLLPQLDVKNALG
jgi:hypothetical protein